MMKHSNYRLQIHEIIVSQKKKTGGLLELGLYVALNLCVILALIVSVRQSDWNHTRDCIKILILFNIPFLAERVLKIQLPSIFISIIHLFMYAAIILGEMDSFYAKYPLWDNMLHTLNGMLCTCGGFMILQFVAKARSLQLKPFFVILFTFCFSMTVAVMWEFYEFGMDRIVDRDMQKDTIIHEIKSYDLSEDNHLAIVNGITDMTVNGTDYHLGGYLDIGLYDTMNDLFDNMVGTVLFCGVGAVYLGKKKSSAMPAMSDRL